MPSLATAARGITAESSLGSVTPTGSSLSEERVKSSVSSGYRMLDLPAKLLNAIAGRSADHSTGEKAPRSSLSSLRSPPSRELRAGGPAVTVAADVLLSVAVGALVVDADVPALLLCCALALRSRPALLALRLTTLTFLAGADPFFLAAKMVIILEGALTVAAAAAASFFALASCSRTILSTLASSFIRANSSFWFALRCFLVAVVAALETAATPDAPFLPEMPSGNVLSVAGGVRGKWLEVDDEGSESLEDRSGRDPEESNAEPE
jgi:hypothetical protein